MSPKYKFDNNDKLYFISFATAYWIDVFMHKEYMAVIIDSWSCLRQDARKRKDWKFMDGSA